MARSNSDSSASPPSDGVPVSIEELLAETNYWLRLLALPELRVLIKTHLKTGEDVEIYRHSLGGSVRDVAQTVGVGSATVHRLWTRLNAVGLMRPAGVPGRFVRAVDPRTLDPDLPQMAPRTKAKKKA